MSRESAYPFSEFDPARPDFQVARLADGLGFGHGGISAASPEGAHGNEDLAALTDEALNHPDILTPISADEDGEPIKDDGCGDGRRTGLVFHRVHDDEPDVIYKSSLTRPKVFGGGLTMAAAVQVGLGLAQEHPLNETFKFARDSLKRRGIDYGAHTAMETHGGTGCGAIDRAPEIIAATVQYRDAIRQTIEGLVGESPDLEAGPEGQPGMGVLDHFAKAAEADNSGYDSRAVMNATIQDGRVVKALAEDHMETRIVLNNVRGYTADQSFVREYTGGRAQAFSVDVWRMTDIAEQLYDDPAMQRRALLSQLVYTLATAAVLTKGDLPVFAVEPAPEA